MPVLAVVAAVLSVACGTLAILAAVRHLRTPPELRGDWWTEFEREFRAYASRANRAASQDPDRDRRRRRQRGEPA
jgi:hypothetical protein